MRRARAFALAGAGVVAVGVVGWTLGFLTAQEAPPSLAQASEPEYASVASTEYVDARAVQAEIVVAPANELVVNVGGVVTSSSCAVRGVIRSGESTIAVDGVKLMNLATSLPLWRDLAAGDMGDDVRSLQEELVRLGHNVRVDGIIGSTTIAAVRSLRGERTLATVQRSLFLWIPAPEVTVDTCEVQRGTYVNAGDAVLQVQSSIPTVTVSGLSADALPGQRVLVVDNANYSLGADLTLADPAQVQQLLYSSAYLEARTDDSSTRIPAVAELATPAAVSSVPPSAIIVDPSGHTCVIAEAGPAAVVIVGSQLGQTFVTFADEQPPRVLIEPGASATCQ